MKHKLTWLVVVVVVLVLGGAFAVYLGTRNTGQNKPTVAIFNLLSHPILDDSIKGIKKGLADAGYTADKVTITEVSANGEMEKLNAIAKELLSAHPTIIVPVSTPVTQAVVKEAGTQQQIVFSTVTNPADVGMDKKPANMTGVSDAVNYAANLDLIRELFPAAKRIGVIYNPGERNSQFGIEQIKQLVGSRGLELKLVPVAKSDEVADAARAMVGTIDLIYVGSDNTVVSAMPGLVKIAYDNKLPVIASDSGSVEQGALAAVSVDYQKLGERVGAIVAQLLREGKPASTVPNVMFVGETLIVNKKAAGKLGFQFPANVSARAGRTIE